MAQGLAAALFVILAVIARPEPVEACAPAPREGDEVLIHAEEALIVYDARAHREHFIRRADFGSNASDFGFLVPTPSPPELGEVDDTVFDRLASAVAPPIEHTTEWVPMTCCSAPFQLTMASARSDEAVAVQAAPGGVEVLSTARVAGLDATVIRATDTEALAAWLSERGYPMRPALSEWLEPYVARGFAITAFKIAKGDAASSAIGTRSVRMTFATEQAFYPYREPSDLPATPGRTLRVFLVSGMRYDGHLDDRSAWRSGVTYARHLESPAELLGAIPTPADRLWLTAYVDDAAQRATGGDLWFTANGARDEIVPDPIVVVDGETPLPIPIEPVLVAGAGVWWWRRRKRGKAAAA